MFVDFAIDSSGDLTFKEQDNINSSLKIGFFLSSTSANKIVFDFADFTPITPSKNALKVEFEIVKRTANKTANTLKDMDALTQLLSLKLKTTLGELPLRQTFGSKVSLLKHKEINQINLQMLENYIEECISDIVPNAVVEATPYIDYNNGYKQTILIKIYSAERILLDYIIER